MDQGEGFGFGFAAGAGASRSADEDSGKNPQLRRQAEWRSYVQGCARRDQGALAALYDQSNQLVYSVALRVLRDPEDAAEVVVDVYRQVWDSAAQFDERRGSAPAWLIILARSRAIDRRRSQTTRGRMEFQMDEFPTVVCTAPTPENLAASNEVSRSVRQAMAEVPFEQRQAIELSFFAGLSHGEIASHLGEPLGTVKTRIRLGVGKLRELLRDTI
jgi:RNA polymerase sigma-70 factor (ECF subfamily)